MNEELWTALYLEPLNGLWEVRMRIAHVCAVFAYIYKLVERPNNNDEVFMHVYNWAVQNPLLALFDFGFIAPIKAPLPPFPYYGRSRPTNNADGC